MFAVTSKTPGEGRRAYSPSAYFFFAHEQRVNLQEEYPDATISAIQKTSAQLWQKMNTSERAPYEELALGLETPSRATKACGLREQMKMEMVIGF
ncbi:putative High mobility group B protein 1 [Glarea lozoyensis 74030]|uniref:Putative High mobility group B protein 1 n=1 Tax=Glarea lozoyensis (strain ATCC 74030 / MF5533) TaxID=1104152 RepID=H0EQQ2_GLAL7|nr:putative High mobility group B protein 1 [Glarea lozoyensis 74030]